MNEISCNAVRDLLPLYVDGVVSEETRQEIINHLSKCPECHAEYEQLQKELTLPANPDLHSESAHALKSIKHTIVKKKIMIAAASVLVTLSLVIAGYFVVTEVGPVHDYLFPELHAVVNNTSSEHWQPVTLYHDGAGTETTNVLIFDRIFYNKELINHANSDSEVTIQILDVIGNPVMEPLVVQPGESVSLKQLENHTEYRIEAKITGTGKKVFLNIV